MKISIAVLLILSIASLRSVAVGDTTIYATAPSGALSASAPKVPVIIDRLKAAEATWNTPNRVFLYVDSSSHTPPQSPHPVNSVELPGADSIDGISQSNGLVPQWFGDVYAVAPAEMTVLNTDPALADLPIGQLAGADPIIFLLGSLTEYQFNLLATTGLGMNDLTPDQQTLFEDMLPNPFKIIPADAEPPYWPSDAAPPSAEVMKRAQDTYNEEVITVPPAEVNGQVRLHAYVNISYCVGNDGQAAYGYGLHNDGKMYSSGDKKLVDDRNEAFNGESGASGLQSELSGLLKSTEPNVPKPADLSWRRKELSVKINSKGAMTVDELVEQIAKGTRLELYADPWYGQEELIIGGDAKESPTASELMQALALCVCGTWRQVGPAFVLTNDVEGLGARRQFLADIVSVWSNRLETVTTNADRHLKELRWLSALNPVLGDTTDISKAQLLAVCGSNSTGSTKWRDLPNSVQNLITEQINREINQSELDANDVSAQKSILESINPNKEVDIDPDIEISLELPGTGVMSYTTYEYDAGNSDDDSPIPTSTEKISMPEALRGVICSPKSVAEAVKTVDTLPALGLNTLFLDVFNNGRTYFQTSSIPPETDDASKVLTATVAEGVKKGVNVYAVIDTLCWRKDGDSPRPALWPSQFDEDLNVFGEPAYKGMQRMMSQNIVSVDAEYLKDQYETLCAGNGWVSPLDPAVRQALPRLVTDLASTPGIAGLVFQDTSATGYSSSQNNFQQLDLGYTLANRLSFLRKTHIDPVDVGGVSNAALGAMGQELTHRIPFDFTVPEFNESSGLYTGSAWFDERSDGDLSLLKLCFDAARKASPKLPLYMRERQMGATIDRWTDENVVDQIASTASSANPSGYVNDQTILSLPVEPYLSYFPGSLPWATNELISSWGLGKAGGIALDLESGDITENVPKLLDLLGQYLPITTSPN